MYRYKIQGHTDVDTRPTVYPLQICHRENETRRGEYIVTLQKVMRAECIEDLRSNIRSKAIQMLTLDQLCTLFKYAIERMKHERVSILLHYRKS